VSSVLASPPALEIVEVPAPAAAVRRRRGAAPSLGRAPEALALSCAGVLLVALAYGRGRTGGAYAMPLYWVGQLLVFGPVAARMLARRLAGTGEAFALTIGLAVNQYLLKWAYSPDQFRFPDELQHWVSTTTLVETGQLFHANHALPAAVHFPALEEMCAAVVAMSGMSVTNAGLILAGVAHVVFVGALFMLARRTGVGPAVAGTACVIYATGIHYLFFDSMYIYQTAALPFLVLAVWASRRWRVADRMTWPFGVFGAVSIVVVSVSHHVTALVTVATLALIAACEFVAGRRARPRETLLLALVGLATVAAWFGLVARDVVGYLGMPLLLMLGAVARLAGHRAAAAAPAGGGGQLWTLAVQAAGLLVLLGVFALWSYPVVRAGRRSAWQYALLVGGVLFFAANGLRFVGAQGPELAGRAATFTYLPMSLLAATAVRRFGLRAQGGVWRRVLAGRIVVGTLALLLLALGARVGGWPPLWALLPGPYLVSGYERSIDPDGVAAARWMAQALPHGQRVAADSTGWNLVSTYGRQDPVGEASALYYATTWDTPSEQLRQRLAVDYLWVDLRLTRQTPWSGAYFPVDPQAGRHPAPMSMAVLTKFDHVPGISRIYDGGPIRLYALEK
jgi:hypothetical protein